MGVGAEVPVAAQMRGEALGQPLNGENAEQPDIEAKDDRAEKKASASNRIARLVVQVACLSVLGLVQIAWLAVLAYLLHLLVLSRLVLL